MADDLISLSARIAHARKGLKRSHEMGDAKWAEIYQQEVNKLKAERAKLRANQTRFKMKRVAVEDEAPGEKLFRFDASKGRREVAGSFSYMRPEKALVVHSIGPKIEGMGSSHVLSKAENYASDPGLIRSLLKEAKKRFPAAEEVRGTRVTGAHAKAFESAHGALDALDAPPAPTQKLKLKALAKTGKKALGVAGQAMNIPEHWRALNMVSQSKNKKAPFSDRLGAYVERVLGVPAGTTGRNSLPSEREL